MRQARTRTVGFVLFVIATLVTACAPSRPATSGAAAPPEKPAVKKVLTIGDAYEPAGIIESFSPARKTTGNNVTPMLHDDFSYAPTVGGREALLATELPSFERGTWKLNPDGTDRKSVV